MTVFRTTTGINPKHLVCSACGQSERIWSETQITRWRRAHVANCAANRDNGTRLR